ncbi:MAG: AfsR/SARP family transcriptional regulator, partial [Nocardioides sp.]
GLIEKLWPAAADEERARGSLRTALSHIRRALQTNCVLRHPEGLLLQGAWVDAGAFLERVRLAQHAAREGQHDWVLTHTSAAEELYRDDFHAHDDDSAWASDHRLHLRGARQAVLCDAAESALAVKHHRDALRFASGAALLDPASETAHRLLMRAHAELGEIGNALRVFETLRSHLSDELGADPSWQTREIHMRLLRAPGT